MVYLYSTINGPIKLRSSLTLSLLFLSISTPLYNPSSNGVLQLKCCMCFLFPLQVLQFPPITSVYESRQVPKGDIDVAAICLILTFKPFCRVTCSFLHISQEIHKVFNSGCEGDRQTDGHINVIAVQVRCRQMSVYFCCTL